VAAIILTGTVIASGMPVIGYSTLSYVWLALLAFVPQLIGHSSFNWALRYLSAAYVSVSTLGEPIGSTILAVLFLREWPSALKVFGAILILLGISVASIGEKA
jgi:drug/metabolite transporter (DMT)-like permease